jgi:FkbM family methyltransferase
MQLLILKLLYKLKILDYINITCRVNNIRIPIIGSIGFTNIQGTEKWMLELIKLIHKDQNGCFMDVGVNIGQSLIKVKSVDRNIQYIGFEPNPACVFYCEKLIEKNNFPNTVLIPAGISINSELVTLELFDQDTADSSASIVKEFRPKTSVIRHKRAIVLNEDIIKYGGKVSIIKIDVEGAELYVIEGLLRIIERERPSIIIEILPIYSIDNQERLMRQNRLLEIVKDLRYSIFRINKNSNDSLKGFNELPEISIHSDLTLCDYLIIPSERRSHVLSY